MKKILCVSRDIGESNAFENESSYFLFLFSPKDI